MQELPILPFNMTLHSVLAAIHYFRSIFVVTAEVKGMNRHFRQD